MIVKMAKNNKENKIENVNENKDENTNAKLNAKVNENEDENRNAKSRKNKKDKKSNIALRIIKIVLAIIAIIIIVAYIAMKMVIGNKLGKMQYENINATSEELGISDNEKKSEFRNIAILGIDSRYNDYEDFARTDCIMIASINKNTGDINLFSIYRDTLVEMELNGKTRLDKINHAYYGGVENTLKTINTNFDLNVSEFVNVDFEAVADMVDAVGGVEINITSDELKYINSYIKGNMEANGTKSSYIKNTGLQKLDGNQALAYGRIRYTEGGDFKRTERMRTVLQKVFDKLKGKNVTELNSILNVVLPKVQTNLTKNEIESLIPKMLNTKINATFGFPYNASSTVLDLKDYYKGTTKGKDYYDVPVELTNDVERLHREIFGEENYTAPDKVKEIYEEIKKVAKIS